MKWMVAIATAIVAGAACHATPPRSHALPAPDRSARHAVSAIADRVGTFLGASVRLPRPDDMALDAQIVMRWDDSVDVWLSALGTIDTSHLRLSAEWVVYGVLREGLQANAGLRTCRSVPLDRHACYQAKVRAVTGYPLSDADLSRISLEEQAKLDAEIAPLAVRLLGTSDVNKARRRLRNDPRFMAASREEILAVADTALARTRARLTNWFVDVPPDPLIIRPELPANEATMPGGRYAPPTGSDSVAELIINTYKPESRGRADIVNAAIHEGYPGHHLQFAMARRAPAQHPVLAWFRPTAFVEGWAFYAERLADEMGVYSDDLSRAWYRVHLSDGALALRIDAALNTGHWTREQAVDTMMQVAGRQRWQAELYADRHLTTRAQTVSYMLGYRTIMQLRAEASRRLGAKFDIKQFHAAVLRDGPVTLPMLRQKLAHWIAAGGR